MKLLKKNQLAILVIALMLITAGYLNYTSGIDSITANANSVDNKVIGALGDAELVNSGELLEQKDKEQIKNTIVHATSNDNTIENSVDNTITNTLQTNTAPADDYFASSKLEREKMYSQMLENYQKILENANISAEQKAVSQQEINKINQVKNAIMIVENLIQTKGFNNSVVFVNDNSVSVVVKAEELQADQIAQLQNILSRELKVEIENIHISKK